MLQSSEVYCHCFRVFTTIRKTQTDAQNDKVDSVDPKCLQTQVKMVGLCNVKKKEKKGIYHVRTFSTFILKLLPKFNIKMTLENPNINIYHLSERGNC